MEFNTHLKLSEASFTTLDNADNEQYGIDLKKTSDTAGEDGYDCFLEIKDNITNQVALPNLSRFSEGFHAWLTSKARGTHGGVKEDKYKGAIVAFDRELHDLLTSLQPTAPATAPEAPTQTVSLPTFNLSGNLDSSGCWNDDDWQITATERNLGRIGKGLDIKLTIDPAEWFHNNELDQDWRAGEWTMTILPNGKIINIIFNPREGNDINMHGYQETLSETANLLNPNEEVRLVQPGEEGRLHEASILVGDDEQKMEITALSAAKELASILGEILDDNDSKVADEKTRKILDAVKTNLLAQFVPSSNVEFKPIKLDSPPPPPPTASAGGEPAAPAEAPPSPPPAGGTPTATEITCPPGQVPTDMTGDGIPDNCITPIPQ